MNNTRQFLALSRAFHTQVTRNAADVGPKTARVKQLQKQLQVDDGVPVHLKTGVKDKILFQFTALLTLVGVGMSIDTLYRIGTGQK